MATIDELEIQITSDSATAVKGIRTLTSSLKKLAKVVDIPGLDKLSSSLKGVANATTGIKKLNISMGQTAKTTAKMANSASKAGNAFGFMAIKTAALSAAIFKISKYLGDALAKSAEYTENLNMFTVSLGNYASEAYDYAEEVRSLMGIDISQWLQNQGIFMSLAKGFGTGAEEAAKMSKNLNQLAYDLSSYYNLTTEESVQKVRSAFSGELEPIRNLGYDLSVTKLQEIANAIADTTKQRRIDVDSMTQAEKAQLRYIAMMTQVVDVQTDLTRTIMSPANLLRVLKSRVEELTRAIGDALMPTLRAVLPPLIAFIEVITDIVSSFAGTEKPVFDQTAESIESVATSVDDTTDALKKMKSQMMGFDELNVISASAASNIGDYNSGLKFDLPEYTGFTSDEFRTQIDTIKQQIKDAFSQVAEVTPEIMYAIGCLLLITGNLPLGLGLVVGSGLIMAAQEYNIDIDDIKRWLAGAYGSLSNALLSISAIVGVIGLALAIIGNPLVGIGMLATSGIFAYGAVQEDTGAIKKWLEDKFGSVWQALASVGVVMLVSGLILLFIPGAIAPALGMIFGGIGLISKSLDGDPDALKNALVGWFTTSWTDLRKLSVFGAIVGSVLLFVPGAKLIGVGLLAASAATFFAPETLSWGGIKETLTSMFDGLWGEIAVLSAALMVIGAILAFSGVGLGIGIAMLAIGAGGLYTAADMNSDYVLEWLKNDFTKIETEVAKYSLGLGALLLLGGPATLPLAIGLLGLGAGSLGIANVLNPDYTAGEIKKMLANIEYGFKVFVQGTVNIFEGLVNGLIGLINKAIGLINKIPGIDIAKLDYVDWQVYDTDTAKAERDATIARIDNSRINQQSYDYSASHTSSSGSTHTGGGGSFGNSATTVQNHIYLDGKEMSYAIDKANKARGALIYPGGNLNG